jgi:hypothetical protein
MPMTFVPAVFALVTFLLNFVPTGFVLMTFFEISLVTFVPITFVLNAFVPSICQDLYFVAKEV